MHGRYLRIGPTDLFCMRAASFTGNRAFAVAHAKRTSRADGKRCGDASAKGTAPPRPRVCGQRPDPTDGACRSGPLGSARGSCTGRLFGHSSCRLELERLQASGIACAVAGGCSGREGAEAQALAVRQVRRALCGNGRVPSLLVAAQKSTSRSGAARLVCIADLFPSGPTRSAFPGRALGASRRLAPRPGTAAALAHDARTARRGGAGHATCRTRYGEWPDGVC